MIKKVICFFFGIPIALIALVGLSASYNDNSSTSPRMIFISLLVLGGLILFQGFRIKVEKMEERQKRIEYAKTHIESKHQAGLPLSEGAKCTIEYGEVGFIFKSSGNLFNMDFKKITDICMKTSAEIQQQYISSAGGAVGGALLFGPLGAIVGGRTKKKETRTITYYLIFTYHKDGAVDYISFEIYDKAKANQWIADFKQKHYSGEVHTIEL